MRLSVFYIFAFLSFLPILRAGGLSTPALAETDQYSETIYGVQGLNTVPSARMSPKATVKAGVSTLDPYGHIFLGFQLAEPLYINLRQSAELSNIQQDPDRLYPGIDLKLRLIEESANRPAVALGLQSAVGHKRMAGEYLAISKRYKNFDFTAGLGWGRFGSAGHFDNPLKSLGGHFGRNRPLDGERPNEPGDWFTGEKIGIFGGLEYFTPLEGVSIKFDWGADRYAGEQSAFNFQSPPPWSLGLSWKPSEHIRGGLALQGKDKIMGRLTLSGNLTGWPYAGPGHDESKKSLRPYRTGLSLPAHMRRAAMGEGITLYNLKTGSDTAQARLPMKRGLSAPYQIGRAAIHMANHAGETIEELSITPSFMGLRGRSVHLMRRDLEQALAKKQGSAQEIWRGARFIDDTETPWRKLRRLEQAQTGLRDFYLTLNNHVSLAEEDHGILYRTSLQAGSLGPRFFGLLDSGFALRLNLEDNLHKLDDFRPRAALPVRSDVDRFASRFIALDESWMALTHSFRTDLHVSLIGGYLEEMYAGLGGEVLFRPFKSRLAGGFELWQVFKRDPETPFSLGLSGDRLLTGHVNLWYDLPWEDLTFQAQAGRYLAEDIGASITLQKQFQNGVKLEGFLTITDQSDFDLFGGTTHAYHGVRLSLPLGGIKYLPRNTQIKLEASPLGRDTGQALKKPLPLYEATDHFSYSHMIRNWQDITHE